MIQELDTTLGVAPIFVPADGNCMAWSLRCLFLGAYLNQNYKSKASLNSVLYIRNIIHQMWREKSADPLWHRVFSFCYQEYMLEQRPEPREQRPEPREQGPEPGKQGPAPGEHEPKSNKKVKRAARAAPVPVAARKPADPTLKAPDSVHERFMEPPVPDLEEMVSDSLLKGHKSKVSDAKQKVVSMEEVGDVEEEDRTRRMKPHTRLMKKKPVDIAERRQQHLIKFLASKSLTNGDFMRLHRRSAFFRKAGACPEGNFKTFREHLLAGKLPSCETCQGWMADRGVTLEKIQEMLKEVEAETPLEVAEVQQEPELKPEELVPRNKESRQSRAEIRRACVDYLNSVPHIEAVDGQVLKYRCTLCVSKKNPQGKINKIGEKPTLNTVHTFVDEHLRAQSHVKALSNLKPPVDPPGDDADAGEACEGEPCLGYLVSNAKSTGTLHFYNDEFAIWMAHTKLDPKASHTYHQNATDGTWCVKHKSCTGVRPSDGLCCKVCERLGEPKQVQRLVVSFTRNFTAAHLLSRKLYSTPEELADFVKEIEASAFGRFNCQIWKGLQELTLIQLQAFVASSYQFFPEHLMTTNLKYFKSTVVDPCLRVNVTNIDQALAPVAAQFVSALANRRLNDAVLR